MRRGAVLAGGSVGQKAWRCRLCRLQFGGRFKFRDRRHHRAGGPLRVGETELGRDGLPDMLAGSWCVLAVVAQFRKVDRLPEGLDFGRASGATGDVGVDGTAQALAEGE